VVRMVQTAPPAPSERSHIRARISPRMVCGGPARIHLRNVLACKKFSGKRAIEFTVYTVAQVAHLTTPPRKLSDCGTAS
jgi:hypothetical protein